MTMLAALLQIIFDLIKIYLLIEEFKSTVLKS